MIPCNWLSKYSHNYLKINTNIVYQQTLFTTTNFILADSFPRDTSYNVLKAWKNISKSYPNAKIIQSTIPQNVKVDRDIVYTTLKNTPFGDRSLQLDIFHPKKEGKYPVLILIHGGGWRSGDKTMEHPMAEYVASHGYVTIAVEYRLSLEAQYPNAVYDIKKAIHWLKANADKYSIDTAHIAIEGNSAGGQLAALVGMTNGISKFEGSEGATTETSDIHVVIDIDGVVDFLAPASLNLSRYPDWLGGSFIEKPQVWKDASPAFWVSKRAVPVLFITSTQPKYHAGMEEMIDMLSQVGVYSEKHQIPDSPHTFWLYSPWYEPTVKYMVAFLDRVFKGGIKTSN